MRKITIEIYPSDPERLRDAAEEIQDLPISDLMFADVPRSVMEPKVSPKRTPRPGRGVPAANGASNVLQARARALRPAA